MKISKETLKKNRSIKTPVLFYNILFLLYIVVQNGAPASEKERYAPYSRKAHQCIEYPADSRPRAPEKPRNKVKPEYPNGTPIDCADYNKNKR